MEETNKESQWSRSDSLAVALACLAGVMALALLFWKATPGWVVGTLIAMAVLMVYPVCHFAHSGKARVPILLIVWVVIGLFGWKNWPRPESHAAPDVPVAAVAPSNSAPQTAPEKNAKPTPHLKTTQPAPQQPPSQPQASPSTQTQECQGSICNQNSPVDAPQTVNNFGPVARHLTADQKAAIVSALAGKQVKATFISLSDVPDARQFAYELCDAFKDANLIRECSVGSMMSGSPIVGIRITFKGNVVKQGDKIFFPWDSPVGIVDKALLAAGLDQITVSPEPTFEDGAVDVVVGAPPQ
jgi:hypothetical protein